MTPKLNIAVLLIAVPMSAQARSPSAPKVNKGDAQKVVTIITGDKAKTQTFCVMKKLGEQVEEASAKQDGKTVSELSQKIETMEKPLVPNIWHCSTGFRT
jgi:hypothetical protein